MAVQNSERPILPSDKKPPTPPLDNQLEEDVGDLQTLEGYFDNLASSAVSEKESFGNCC